MKQIRNILAVIIALALTASCSKDDDVAPVPVVKDDVDTVHVALILPQFIKDEWQNSIDWALQNIERAQSSQQHKVRLQLHYYDEDKVKLDDLGFDLVHPMEGPDSCSAIIGPYHSDNAAVILSYAAQNRTPVVMPTCTSAELQRMNARNTYAWFLTESDVTQCEVMLQAAKTLSRQEVALLYSDDTYGKSFYDWFGYWAVELGMTTVGGIGTKFKVGDNLNDFFSQIENESTTGEVTVFMAFSNPKDYINACEQLYDYEEETGYLIYIQPFFTDVALTNEVITNHKIPAKLGISPTGSVSYGYPQAAQERFGKLPTSGEAQVYDALTLVALGSALQHASPDECLVNGKQVVYDEAPYEPGLTDYMRSVVASSEGEHATWTDTGLAIAFRELNAGRSIDCEGATGTYIFDAVTNTKMLETVYMMWTTEDMPQPNGEQSTQVHPICYLSTGGSAASASTATIWEQTKRYQQQFQPDLIVDHNLPQVKDHWAVVISPSTTWANYRHQADAFAMYQTLRNHGYDDDHIVLIVEDNLVNDPSNKFPGHIYVERSDDPDAASALVNEDVRSHAVVDYHFSELTQDDIADIMLGRQSDRLPHVIHSDSTSNVFFFWSGHGGSYEGPLWGNENAREYFGTKRIRDIAEQMNDGNKYRRMMFSIETCFSGLWGQALTGLPDLLVLTAANGIETSKADVHDPVLGVFLSNAFARTFRQYITENNDISIHDLYKELAKTTTGSHVSIYNEQNYGSVFTNAMTDYMPE